MTELEHKLSKSNLEHLASDVVEEATQVVLLLLLRELGDPPASKKSTQHAVEQKGRCQHEDGWAWTSAIGSRYCRVER